MKPTAEEVAMTETNQKSEPQPSNWFRKIVTGSSRKTGGRASFLPLFVAFAAMTSTSAPAAGANHPGPRATVELHGGVPVATIDGNAHNGMLRTGGSEVELFRQAGVDVFSFVATASQGFWVPAVWVAPGRYDYSPFDQIVRSCLKLAPKARLLPRIEMSAPDWWRAKYPDELVQIHGTNGKPEPLLLPLPVSPLFRVYPHLKRKTVPCWASQRWREDTAEAIRRMIAHVAQSDYADRIIGWHIGSGESHEWFMWADAIDISPSNLAAYRRWLRAKYLNEHSLRLSWGKPAVTFADAMPPTEQERARNPAGGILRNPATEQYVLDFIDYNHWMVADTIDYLASATRQATGGTKLIGVSYGYVFGLRGEPRQQCAGHHALQRLLDSPNINLLNSPHLYWHYRRLGTGTPATMDPLDSTRLHGKFWINETDTRTSMGPQSNQSKGIDEDVLQQRRQLSWIISRGLAHWWFDVGGISYDHPDVMAVIKQGVEAAESAKALDRSPVDEVAFVVDEGSVKYLNVGDKLGEDLLTGQLPALCRMGAPVGDYALHDVSRISDRKLFVFGGVLAPSGQARRDIDALKGRGRVLVFTYAPGLYREGKWDEAAMETFAGVRIRKGVAPEKFEAVIKTSLPEFANVNGVRFGVPRKVEPAFFPVEEKGVDVIARLDDGRPAVVMRRFDDWTVVFSSVPLLPAVLLNRLAAMAGVHLYSEPGVALWASQDAVALSVDHAQTVKIRLPSKRHVTDVWATREIGDVQEIEVVVPEHDSRLFFLKRGR